MYICEEMIDLGIKKNYWKSENHKQVAKTIALCNPNVTARWTLDMIRNAINKVPKNKIKKILYNDLVAEFNMPDVGIYK